MAMNVMDNILSKLKMETEEDNDYLTDEDTPEELAKMSSSRSDSISDEPRKPVFAARSSNAKGKKLGNGMEVCVIKPTSVDDAREITDTLLSNRTVVLNMEGLDVDIAQRIIDFTSGSTYAMDGNLQKISHYIFIITPQSVDISGDFPTLMSDSFDVPQF